MGELLCVDGSLLGVAAIPCHDRAGQPYEMTLQLVRDQQPFGMVGQRCGHQLAALAAQVQAAREDPEQAAKWPDPDDRFPVPAGPARLRAGLVAFEPNEREYFTLRSRDREDFPGQGEVRCVLRSSAHWHPGSRPGDDFEPGHWRLSRRCVVEAWGETGTGVRAVLTSAELVTFLDTVLGKPDAVVVGGSAPAAAGGSGVSSPRASTAQVGRRPRRRG